MMSLVMHPSTYHPLLCSAVTLVIAPVQASNREISWNGDSMGCIVQGDMTRQSKTDLSDVDAVCPVDGMLPLLQSCNTKCMYTTRNLCDMDTDLFAHKVPLGV